jgi:putative oxidoreductase
MDSGLLIARLILGCALGAHGAQKLFGWFGGHGLKGTGRFFEGIGFRPGAPFALAAGMAELGGGVLMAAGFLWPVGPALCVMVMLVAMLAVHWGNGFFASSNGIELPLLYLTGALALAFPGPGAYSLDAALRVATLSDPVSTWLLLAGAAGLALVNLAVRWLLAAPARRHA